MRSPPLPPTAPIGRIHSLDGIRGIAAMNVVLFHLLQARIATLDMADHPIITLVSHWPLRLLWGGFEAVIGFFILSGMVLALPFLRHPGPRWTGFAARRVLRLYPAYLAALLLSAGGVAALAGYRTDALVRIFNFYWSQDVAIASVLRDAFMITDDSNVNGALWSLVHEMRISLIFPLVFAATLFLGGGLSLLLGAALSLGAMAILFSYPVQEMFGPATVSLFKTVYFLFFFVLGINLAVHRARLTALLSGKLREGRLAFAIIGVGLMGLQGHLPYEAGGLAIGVGFALLILVVLTTERGNTILQSAIPQFLGKISFSLYLAHVPVLHGLFYWLHGRVPAGQILLLAFVGSILAGWLFWHLVERPSMALSRRVALG